MLAINRNNHIILERELANWCGMDHVVACSSGTAALHLALESMLFSGGSEIIIPEFTMIACPRAAIMAGLRPVFVDCKDDLTIDEDRILDKIGPKTKAIMPVHIYGRRCNMPVIAQIAEDYNLRIIEDLAEAHGIAPHPQTDAACWSFYRNKIIAGEEGGAVAFSNEHRAKLATSLRSLGMTEAHDFLHNPRGNNYRMSNVHALLILKSLKRFRENQEQRRRIEGWYDSRIPDKFKMPRRSVVWMYDIRRVSDPTAAVHHLNQNGISARTAFKPMSMQTEFIGSYDQLNAFRMSKQILYLPVSPDMSEDSVDIVVNTLLSELRY